jgi:hypothetical protein
MAATKNLIAYAASAQLACSIASLATGTSRESATQSNSTNLYFDYGVALTFTIVSGTPTSTGPFVNIYAVGSVDGTIWPIIELSGGTTKTLGGGDASVGALSVPNQLSLIGQFAFQSTGSGAERTFRTEMYSVASGFNGVCPEAFSIVIENQTGIAFSASTVTTANYLDITGIYTTSGN